MPHKHVVKGKWTGKWFGQYKRSGERVRKLFETKTEAVAWEVDMKRGSFRPQAIPEPTTKTGTVSLTDWANRYLDYSLRYHPKVYSEKKNAMKGLIQFMGKSTPVNTITPGRALEFLESYFKQHSGHSTNKLRKNLCAGWNWAAKFIDGFPNVNPFDAVPKYPEECHPRYTPPPSDFQKVLDVANGQDRVMLLTLVHTAARRGEVYRLTWDDVDFTCKQIRLTTRKRENGSMQADQLPMTDELFNVLLEHRKTAVNEWVFVQTVGRHRGKPYTENRDFPKELCFIAGVKPFGCHGIRHMTAPYLAANNVPVKVIQEILRHKKLATTEMYVRGLEPVRPHLRCLEGGFSGLRSNDGSNKKAEGLGGCVS